MDEDSLTIEARYATHPEAALPGFAHAFRTVDGLSLHHVIGGRDDAPTVLLLAGFPQSWFAWRHVMPRLADTFRVIALDLPGQGFRTGHSAATIR